MRNHMKKVKIALLSALLLSPCVFAQSDASINGSVGYTKMVLDEFKDYPFRGIGFDFGASGYTSSGFAGSAGINYVSVSAEDKNKIELTLSELDLYLIPKFRFGEWDRHIDIGMQISIPLSNDATIKAPGYETQELDTKKPENSFMLMADIRHRLFQVQGILDEGTYIDLVFSVGKILTGTDKPVTIGAGLCLNAFCPNISYATGDAGNQLYIGIGFNYYLNMQQRENKYEYQQYQRRESKYEYQQRESEDEESNETD